MMTLLDGFTVRALDATSYSLDAVVAGLPFEVDDLIAGVMALDSLALNNAQPAQNSELRGRLRALVNSQCFARTPEGRAEAGQLVMMVRALRGGRRKADLR